MPYECFANVFIPYPGEHYENVHLYRGFQGEKFVKLTEVAEKPRFGTNATFVLITHATLLEYCDFIDIFLSS